jgi:hypothetical protein
MSWKDCNKNEQKLILQCLVGAAEGPFFPDWEFDTLIGSDKENLKYMIQQWDSLDKTSDEVMSVIVNAVTNLINYPHGHEEAMSMYISATEDNLKNILSKLRI